MPAHPNSRSLSVRWRIFALLAIAILLPIAWRVAKLHGMLRPIRIASGSMAPFLLGPRIHARCAECDVDFEYGVDHLPLTGIPVCPNCGFFGQPASQQEKPGQTIVVDRGGFLFSAPARWQVVALAAPPEKRFTVKRIVGLPGERLTLARGELFVNDELARKSYATFCELATLVFRPANRGRESNPQIPLRWRAHSSRLADASQTNSHLLFPGQGEKDSPLRNPNEIVFEYHHWPCTGPPGERVQDSPVLDLDAYNQGLSRGLNETTDLALRFRALLPADATLTARLHDGAGPRSIQFSGQGTVQIVSEPRDGTRVFAPVPLPHANTSPSEMRLEVAIVDRQIWVVVNDRQIVNETLPAFAPDQIPSRPSDDQLANWLPALIGAGNAIEVSNLEVWRDVYWLCPDGTGRVWRGDRPLEPDEYFVLGDNTAASEDSRHWLPGSIRRKDVLGSLISRRD